MAIRIVASQKLPPADVLVLGWFEDQKLPSHPWWSGLPVFIRKAIQKQLRRPGVNLDWGSLATMQLAKGRWQNVVIVGLGKRAQWSERRNRLAARRVIRQALGSRWGTIAIAFQKLSPDSASVVTENILLGAYDYRSHKQAPPAGWPEVKAVTLVVKGITSEHAAAIKRGVTIAEMVNHARDLANTPGGLMTPKTLAAAAVKLSRGRKLRVKVLTPVQMEKLKMGALLGVGKGSDEPPRLIVMEYHGAHTKQKPLIFVGKGITFDSGGYNIKPGAAMDEMHMDMAGGGAAMCAMAAIADLKLKVNVVVIVPAAENMISGSGFRPNDILKSMSGINIEIGNTDAEGRLVLADALTYAQKFYQPAMIVDVATLTAAAMIALGQQAAALFSDDPDWQTRGREIGETSGDYVWPMPMGDEYEPLVKATFGDILNSAKTRWGGAIEGAMFLKKFVKHTPWIHLDISPTMSSVEGQGLAPGATGVGVRWLVELARQAAQK